VEESLFGRVKVREIHVVYEICESWDFFPF